MFVIIGVGTIVSIVLMCKYVYNLSPHPHTPNFTRLAAVDQQLAPLNRKLNKILALPPCYNAAFNKDNKILRFSVPYHASVQKLQVGLRVAEVARLPSCST